MLASFAYFRLTLHVTAAAVLLAALPLAGARAQAAPTPELEAAIRAVQHADQADADQYAPQLIAAARDALAQAQALQASRKRRQAQELALRAQVDAELASARSEQAVAEAELLQRRREVDELRRTISRGGDR